jgi:murein DD-endopeptidase MepM/ murein hydrolase activator NlpD
MKPYKLISCALIGCLMLALAFPMQSGVGVTGASFVYPLMGTRVSSYFGIRKHPVLKVVRHHDGIDLAAPDGASIRAVSDGVVVFADPYGGYGKYIVIQHANNMTSHYGHCSQIQVRTGQHIKAGQIIGRVGSTGQVTGPHLHFEIRRDGQAQDPEKFIPGLALAAEG